MSSKTAKLKHRTEWRMIHQFGCRILNIDANHDIDRFVNMATMIASWTDQHGFPPRSRDFATFNI